MPLSSSQRFRAVAAFSLLFACTGCPAVGVLADKIVGTRPVDPVYEPGKLTQLLVIAENYRSPTEDNADGMRLAHLLTDELAIKKVSLMISQEKLMLVRDAKPDTFGKMSVVDVGKAVGATKVLYIDYGGISVGGEQGSDMLKGIGHANVKVIDVAAGEVDFPKDMSDGIPINYETPIRRATDTTTPDTVRNEALVGLSNKIGRLFYQYVPTDIETMDTGK